MLPRGVPSALIAPPGGMLWSTRPSPARDALGPRLQSPSTLSGGMLCLVLPGRMPRSRPRSLEGCASAHPPRMPYAPCTPRSSTSTPFW